jgi:hypothetical protein
MAGHDRVPFELEEPLEDRGPGSGVAVPRPRQHADDDESPATSTPRVGD